MAFTGYYWTTTKIEKLKELAPDNTASELAELFGRTESAIRTVCTSREIKFKRKKRTAKNKDCQSTKKAINQLKRRAEKEALTNSYLSANESRAFLLKQHKDSILCAKW